MLSCKITIKNDIEVRFTGVWRMADVKSAYSAMARSLPAHLASLKKLEDTKREEERSDGRK